MPWPDPEVRPYFLTSKKLEARAHRTTEKYSPFGDKIGSYPHRPFGPVGVSGGYTTQTVYLEYEMKG
jgi:hypothetical protein